MLRSRDLHDGISQLLVSVKLQVESGIAKLSDEPAQAPAARKSFERAASQLNNVLGEVRRISHDLRPALLDDLGLAAALRHLSEEFGEMTQLPTTFTATGAVDSLSGVAKTVLFRVAQETLTNVRRHAGDCTVQIVLAVTPGALQLTVADNGVGFDIDGVAQHPKRGIGLRNMHERLEAIGGTLLVVSSAAGTTVTATVRLS